MTEIIEIEKRDSAKEEKTANQNVQNTEKSVVNNAQIDKPKEKSNRGIAGKNNLAKWRESRKLQKTVIKDSPKKEEPLISQKEDKKIVKTDMRLVILGIMAIILTVGLGAFFLIPSFKMAIQTRLKK